MVVDNNCCYIIHLKSDNWDAPEEFKKLDNDSADGLYELFRKYGREECSYPTAHTFPDEIVDHCPDAPCAFGTEISALVNTVFWRGISTDPGVE